MSSPNSSRQGVPFAPLNLSVQQQQQCQDRLFQLLDRTLRSCDERDERDEDAQSSSSHHQTGVDSRRWKQLKTEANASLYIERKRDTWRDLSLLGDSWKNPRVLLAVGTIYNSLDEVMFGLEVPDFAAAQVRSEMLGKKPLDGAVLAQFAAPTEIDPFQFMGITWMVDKQSWPVNVMVHSRDFVFASATGVINRCNGERIGYEVVQSIDLPQCPPLPKPMVRGKLMYGAIYKQREDGNVDVFIQSYVETQGCIVNKVALATIWENMLGCWDAPRLSELKKLQWCIDNRSVERRQHVSAPESTGTGWPTGSQHCDSCLQRKNLLSRRHHLSDHSTCALCAAPLCPGCRVKRKLKVPGECGSKLLNVDVAVCRSCLLFVQQQQPAETALKNQEVREAAREKQRSRSRRLTARETWEQAANSLLNSPKRYPSISVAELVKLINPLASSGIRPSLRRKTDPVH